VVTEGPCAPASVYKTPGRASVPFSARSCCCCQLFHQLRCQRSLWWGRSIQSCGNSVLSRTVGLQWGFVQFAFKPTNPKLKLCLCSPNAVSVCVKWSTRELRSTTFTVVHAISAVSSMCVHCGSQAWLVVTSVCSACLQPPPMQQKGLGLEASHRITECFGWKGPLGII